jgi:hypothetical protein
MVKLYPGQHVLTKEDDAYDHYPGVSIATRLMTMMTMVTEVQEKNGRLQWHTT